MRDVQRRQPGRRRRAWAAMAAGAAAAAVAVSACGVDNQGAAIACEQFVDQRVGLAVAHRTPSGGATETQPGRWVLRSAYIESKTGKGIGFTCTVDRLDSGWRLVDLRVDR